MDRSKEKEWQDVDKEESYLMAKINMATAQLNLDSDDKGSNFQENDMSVQPDDLYLQLQDYASNTQEVSQDNLMQNTSGSTPTPKPSCMPCGMRQGH